MLVTTKMAARTRIFHRKKRTRSKKVQPVVIVKPKRRRRGPKITRLLKDKTVAKLRYVDTISINPGSAAIASHVFRANSIFDPDSTGTGHQPLMRDEYALLYDNYRVISSKIKVTLVTSGVAGNVVPCLFGVYRDKDTTLSYTLGTSIIEDMRNKGGWNLGGAAAFVAERLKTSTSFNAKSFLSVEGASHATSQAANPAAGQDSAFFQVWASSVSGNDPGSIEFLVQIDYVVEFSDPLVVTPS